MLFMKMACHHMKSIETIDDTKDKVKEKAGSSFNHHLGERALLFTISIADCVSNVSENGESSHKDCRR
jgi:hypothetical protein